MPNLIILRGNSGSGKSTVARRLQRDLGYGTMLIQQDVIRREILRVQDTPENPSIQLIYDLAMYGRRLNYHVIVEGILHSDRYGDMLRKLTDDFDGKVFVYYFDISFQETLRRHTSKPNNDEFGKEEMREWWVEKDYLGVSNVNIINEDVSEDEVLAMIRQDLG